MKKILPAILGITLAGTLATCTQKDPETSPQVPTTKAPDAPTPSQNTTPPQAVTPQVASNEPTTVPLTDNTVPTATQERPQNVIEPPKMNSEGRLEPSEAVKKAIENGKPPAASFENQPRPTVSPLPTGVANPSTAMKMIEREVKYKTPGGLHPVGINISVTGGKISGVRITPSGVNEVTTKFQVKFGEEINTAIIGKTAKNLKIDTVAGASLTSKAFNEFIADISTKGEI